MNPGSVTRDAFLGGRITLSQPAKGFRAGHDSVFLAAAVPAQAGDRVLELGSGVGVAALCLAARVPDCAIVGLEIDAELAGLAAQNAAANGMADRVRFETGDAAMFSRIAAFDHVFFNPPFHKDTGQVSPQAARDRAMRDINDAVEAWTGIALAAVKPGGTVTAIVRADRRDDMLAAAGGAAVIVFPLLPHAGEAPKRVLIRLTQGEAAPMAVAAGLVLHRADGKPTPEAEAILRRGRALTLA